MVSALLSATLVFDINPSIKSSVALPVQTFHSTSGASMRVQHCQHCFFVKQQTRHTHTDTISQQAPTINYRHLHTENKRYHRNTYSAKWISSARIELFGSRWYLQPDQWEHAPHVEATRNTIHQHTSQQRAESAIALVEENCVQETLKTELFSKASCSVRRST